MVDWFLVNDAVNTLGGLIVAVLGVLLLSVARGNRPALLFGLFALTWGTANTVLNGWLLAGEFSPGLLESRWNTPVLGAAYGAWPVASALLVWFAIIHPVPHLTRRWGYWTGGLFAAAVIGLAAAYPWPPGLEPWLVMEWIAVWVLAAAATFGAWLHIARFQDAGPEDRHELLIMAFAFAVYILFRAGESFAVLPVVGPGGVFQDGYSAAVHGLAAVALLTLAGGWAYVWRAAGPGHGIGARNMMIATLVLGLLGQTSVVIAVLGGAPPWGQYGVLRFIMVGTVAYGILRHRFLGIELRVRWGISRSTLLAVFGSAFVVTATVTSEFLLDQYGYIAGGVVVGGLLFVGAPLKRWAEGLARHAVPVTSQRAEAIFRSAIEAASRDGSMTRREERHLMAVADGLAIPAGRALDLLDTVLGGHAKTDRP